MRRASVLPMIQVSCVVGQTCCNVRMIGTMWHVSPIADNRRMHKLLGGSARGNIAVNRSEHARIFLHGAFGAATSRRFAVLRKPAGKLRAAHDMTAPQWSLGSE